MAEKRTFAPVPSFMAEMASKTPGGKPVEPEQQVSPVAPIEQPAPAPAPMVTASVPTPAPARTYEMPVFREREATQKMSVNMPKDLYEALRTYTKFTDTPMTDLIIEGARQELARRKAREGIK